MKKQEIENKDKKQQVVAQKRVQTAEGKRRAMLREMKAAKSRAA